MSVNQVKESQTIVQRPSRAYAFCLAAVAASFAFSVPAHAHCYVGARLFPSTMTFDDPCVADELVLPNVAITRSGDQPPVRETQIGGEWSKRLTENFALSIASAWGRNRIPGVESAAGIKGVETGLKYQFLTMAEDEFVMSARLSVDWGGVGGASVGAEPFNRIIPALYAAKGFGQLPESLNWARPFAISGYVSYEIPTWSRTIIPKFDSDLNAIRYDVDRHAGFLHYAASLQYSLPYLRSHVYDFGFSEFFNRLIPLVEFNLETPISNLGGVSRVTRTTINPGIAWTAHGLQIGAEAIIPVNKQSGRGVGFLVQAHVFLDDYFPIAKPVFGQATFLPNFGDRP